MSATVETISGGRLMFSGEAEFEALHAARQWCADNGISYGSNQRGSATGLLRGDYVIAKWRNLTPKERGELDGTMCGDFRNGPVVISMRTPWSPDPSVVLPKDGAA